MSRQQRRRQESDAAGESRADATRERLLRAALDLFGRYGFDGVSTRMLSEAAEVNLQTINYHFGSKIGLYNSVADYLVAILDQHVGPLRTAMRQRLADIDAEGRRLEPEEARHMLETVVGTMMMVFLSDTSATWARFMVREQAEPTEAFERVYGGIMAPMLGVLRRLVGAVTGEPPESTWVRLRTLSLVGSFIIFRVGRATLYREMGWQAVGPEEASEARSIAADIVASIRPRRA